MTFQNKQNFTAFTKAEIADLEGTSGNGPMAQLARIPSHPRPVNEKAWPPELQQTIRYLRTLRTEGKSLSAQQVAAIRKVDPTLI